MLVEVLISQFKILLQGIEQLDKAIKEAYKAQADKNIFDSLPGAGPQLAPRLLVAFGSNRSRYHIRLLIPLLGNITPASRVAKSVAF